MREFWIAIGFMGQTAFALRFLVQWLASEKARKSVIPIHFWFLSMIGATILLIYAIHLRDPVFTIGQSSGMLIYARNVALVRKELRARRHGA